jgi:hypothetical protein
MIRFYLDNHQLLETDPNKLLGIIFSSINDINYWSTEAIENFIIGTYEQLKIFAASRKEEIVKDKNARSEKTRLTKFINHDIIIPKSRDKLISFYYKQILVSEKKGLLTGFKIGGTETNAEYTTIRKFEEKDKENE